MGQCSLKIIVFGNKKFNELASLNSFFNQKNE